MPPRIKPLTPWGKEVRIRMIRNDITPKKLIETIRGYGLIIDESKLSKMLSGTVGQRSPDVVACIDKLFSIPDDVPGRPA